VNDIFFHTYAMVRVVDTVLAADAVHVVVAA
jgi:hypothetical protein